MVKLLIFSLLFSSMTRAEDNERVFSVTCYLNGKASHTYWVTGDVSATSTRVTFYLKNTSDARVENGKFVIDGQVEAISTLSSMFVVYTSGPGENTYIFREVGDTPAIVWRCTSRFAAEVGPNWAMCFQGEKYQGHTLIPEYAVVYGSDGSGTYRKQSTVPYVDRYRAISEGPK